MDQTVYDVTYCALDLETTGHNPAFHEVLEIGAVKFHLQHGMLDKFSTLVRPKLSIPPSATMMHGIRIEMLEDKPLAVEALGRFAMFLGEDAVLVAHNAPFEISFIKPVLLPHQLVVDTWQLSHRLLYSRGFKLRTLTAPPPGGHVRRHRAVPDAEAAAQLFRKCIRVMEGFRKGDPIYLHEVLIQPEEEQRAEA